MGGGQGLAEQGQRPRSRAEQAPGAWPPRAEEACPGREPPLGPENVGRGRDREGDLEEGPVSDVRSPPGSFSQLPAASAWELCLVTESSATKLHRG